MAQNTRQRRLTWLDEITTDSMRQVAELSGISHSTISRAVADEVPPPHVVIAIARAYGHNPVQALHSAGILTDAEIRPYDATGDLRMATTRALLQQALQREIKRENNELT